MQSTEESMGVSPRSSLRSGSGIRICLGVLPFLCPPTASLLPVRPGRHNLAPAVARGEAKAPARGKRRDDLIGEERCWN